MNQLLLTKEAADILRVSEEYLRELIRAGKIKAYKEGRRGGYRIMRKAIDKYIKVKSGIYPQSILLVGQKRSAGNNK